MNAFRLVSRFAALLGWNGIEQSKITLTPEDHGNLPVGLIVTCWSTNDLKFFLQINQKTCGQFGEYKVSVVAERYNIRPMEFVECEFNNNDEVHREAQRLAPLFARKNFRNQQWRRQYLERHPEKLWRVRKKRRGWKARLRPQS